MRIPLLGTSLGSSTTRRATRPVRRLRLPSAITSKAIRSSRLPVPKWQCAESPLELPTIFVLRTSPWSRRPRSRRTRRANVAETTKASPLAAAVLGGLIGAVLTAGAFVFATPQFVSSRIVRQGMLADPQVLVEASDALRDQQNAPAL